jgi:zeta-carotene desaturase
VFVIGGGTAGLVAAFALRERGSEVTLLESRGWLGGRAFSSRDPPTGWPLDNGPHVMLGCYRAMRALLRRLGTEREFRQDRSLTLAFRTASGEPARLSLSRLPVPLGMPPALLRLPWPFAARMRALRGMASSLRGAPASWTLADWCERRGQGGPPDAWLWRPLCRAIMNTEPEFAAASDFLATLREAFAGSAANAAFWLPLRPWSEIIGEPASRALPAAGVTVRLGARVEALAAADGRIAAIVLAAGERIELGAGDLVASAMPWTALRRVLPEVCPSVPEMESSPIVSAYFETAVGASPLPDDGPVVALVDGDPFHFVLRTPGANARRFAVLSGGNRVFDGMDTAAIAAAARAQLERHYRGWSGERAVVRIRKERHATFVAAPGSSPSRPRPGALPGGPHNLRVCGDWTATGLPATLEGAARSAEMMLAGERLD